MGARGPSKGSGGRPKKKLSEKLIEGNLGKRPIKVLKKFPELECEEMPDPRDYLNDTQKNGEDFLAKQIFKDVWLWLKQRGIQQLVSPEIIEGYAFAYARVIQCERLISKYGMLAKNSQGLAIQSPYIGISDIYMKKANEKWKIIQQIIFENCSTEYESGSSEGDFMEDILSGKYTGKDA